MLEAFLADDRVTDDVTWPRAAPRRLQRRGPAARGRAGRWLDLTGVPLHNLYGPTEAAVDVTWWPCAEPPAPGAPRCRSARPIWNTGTVVLDRHLRAVPVDVPGELYLTGVQLARGLPRPAGADRRSLRRRPVRARPGPACTGPATSCAAGRTAPSSTSGAPTTRSRSAATGSSSARSRPRWRRCPAWPGRSWSRDATSAPRRGWSPTWCRPPAATRCSIPSRCGPRSPTCPRCWSRPRSCGSTSCR